MQGANIASPLLTASIQYVINVVLTLPAILFLDRWGRRMPLVLGAFGMMTWLFISGKPPAPLPPPLGSTRGNTVSHTLATQAPSSSTPASRTRATR